MTVRQFHIVDVFAERKYAGNQLAVVRDAGDLEDEEMQSIAKEMNYSETTFVESTEPRNGGYDVRIFTPEEEIPFAGHPTLGTAYVLREEILDDRPDRIALNLPVGQVPVTIEEDSGTLWMDQHPPTFGPTRDPDAAASALGLDVADLDLNFPVQEVSTGLPTIVVPLQSLDALRRLDTDRKRYFELVAETDAKNVLAFCPEARDPSNDLAVRVIAPYYGVPEDPATGSSNGCLAGYLVNHRFFEADKIDVRVEQGYEMGRPSLLELSAQADGNTVNVSVGGDVVPTLDGTLR